MQPDRIVVCEDRHEISFSFEDILRYHGGGSPGGVAHAFKVMQRAFPILGGGQVLERRKTVIHTAFGGPGARDAFELVTRAVTDERFIVDLSLARPELGVPRERFVFVLRCGERAAALTLRAGFVSDEFIDLTRRADRSDAEEQELTAMKADMALRVMSASATAVYDLEAAE